MSQDCLGCLGCLEAAGQLKRLAFVGFGLSVPAVPVSRYSAFRLEQWDSGTVAP